jgi:hypothetical protein
MKTMILAAAGAAALLCAGSAQALTFVWSFVDDATSQTVNGTISGLVEGDNPLSAITVTLLNGADPDALGGGWAPDTVYGYNTAATFFTVTDGKVTFAHGVFDKTVPAGIDVLAFGSNPGLTTYVPQLAGPTVYQTDLHTPESFMAVPEPSTWAFLIAGLGLTGASLRSARRARRPAAV